jgi:hypothetical protein
LKHIKNHWVFYVALSCTIFFSYLIWQADKRKAATEAVGGAIASQSDIATAMMECPSVKENILNPRLSGPMNKRTLEFLVDSCKADERDAVFSSEQMLAVNLKKWVFSNVSVVRHGDVIKMPRCTAGATPAIYRTSNVQPGVPVGGWFSVINDDPNWTISYVNSKMLALPDLVRVIYGCASA